MNLARALRAQAASLEALAAQIEAQETNAQEAPPSGLALTQTGISKRTLRAAIKRGELPARLVGREYRVTREDLQRWIGTQAPRRAVRGLPSDPASVAIEQARAAGRLRALK